MFRACRSRADAAVGEQHVQAVPVTRGEAAGHDVRPRVDRGGGRGREEDRGQCVQPDRGEQDEHRPLDAPPAWCRCSHSEPEGPSCQLPRLQFPRQPSHLPPGTLCRNGRGGATVRRHQTAQVDQSRVKTNLFLTLWVGRAFGVGDTPRRFLTAKFRCFARNDAAHTAAGVDVRGSARSTRGGRDPRAGVAPQ